MDDKFLKKLIRSADAPPGSAAAAPAELTARVQLLHRRRRGRRLAVAACLLAICGGVVWQFSKSTRVNEPASSGPQVVRAPVDDRARLEAALQQTNADIDRTERVVQALLAAERADRLEEQEQEIAARIPPPKTPEEQIGPAAASYLVSGDEKRAIGLPLASAKADYTCVVELFPGTIWAKQAKARLASLPH